MQLHALVLAATLVLVPLSARGTDLVVWWEEEFAPGENDAVREMIADFEQKTGKTVELVFLPQNELPGRLQAALDTGQPPDFEFGLTTNDFVPEWARKGQLVELSSALGPLTELIDKDALAWARWPNARTGRTGLYGMPMVRYTHHVHVWRSLLERAGFTLEDIPKQWEPFWSFWCDRVHSRQCARPWAITTSGVSACRCRPKRPTRAAGWASSPTPSRGTGLSLGARAWLTTRRRRRRWSRR